MNLQLVRYCYGPQHVAGLLKFGNMLSLWTIECPWRDNQIFVSCVPDGSYPLVAFDSPEHPETWVLTPVPGRTGILIHVGNKVEDTQGCILPGLTQDNGVVWNSLDAMRMLNYTLNRSEQHTIALGPGMGAVLLSDQPANSMPRQGDGENGGGVVRDIGEKESGRTADNPEGRN